MSNNMEQYLETTNEKKLLETPLATLETGRWIYIPHLIIIHGSSNSSSTSSATCNTPASHIVDIGLHPHTHDFNLVSAGEMSRGSACRASIFKSCQP